MWILGHLLLQTLRITLIPTPTVWHHYASTASRLWGTIHRECCHTSPSIMDWKPQFYKVFGQNYMCISQSTQLLIRCFREGQSSAFMCQLPVQPPDSRSRSMLPSPSPALLQTYTSSFAAAMNHMQRAFHKPGLLSCIIGKYISDGPAAAKTVCHF